jgi:integrase
MQPATVNRRLAAISSLYTFLSDEDRELVCPILPHRHHLRQRQHLPRPVPEADLRKFFAVIRDARDRVMFILMLRCGLRIAEVAGLTLTDLYLEETPPRLVVNGKGLRERSCYLSSQAETSLQRYLAERPKAASAQVIFQPLAGVSIVGGDSGGAESLPAPGHVAAAGHQVPAAVDDRGRGAQMVAEDVLQHVAAGLVRSHAVSHRHARGTNGGEALAAG